MIDVWKFHIFYSWSITWHFLQKFNGISVSHRMRWDWRKLTFIVRPSVHPCKCCYTRGLGVSTPRHCIQGSPLHPTGRKPRLVRVSILFLSTLHGVIRWVRVKDGSYCTVAMRISNLKRKISSFLFCFVFPQQKVLKRRIKSCDNTTWANTL